MKVTEFLLASIPILIQYYADLYRKIDFENTVLELESELNVPKIKTYDFIIVGGGTAGCVLAGRLSEFFNVLLLEAGGTPPPAVSVPSYTSAVDQNPTINYFFKTVPQTNYHSNNGILSPFTGRMLGGTGSHNAMTHNRGSPKDYDNWATLLNDNSFKYKNVLKYFKRIENFYGPKFGDVGDEYFGKDGPIQVHSLIVPILDTWFDAARELGYPVQDPNAYQREGFATLNVAISKGGQRSNSYFGYVKPYERLRKSLTVIRYANVSEILLDDDKKAYGVAYLRHGFPQIAHARKEIILSAGTHSSPLLLMKSGIGPEGVLNAAEITVKVPLEAVGKNLADQLLIRIPGFSVNDTSIFPNVNTTDVERISEDYHNGKGVLTQIGPGVQGFFVSSKARLDWPDFQTRILPSAGIDAPPSLGVFITLGRPRSKGVLSLDTEKYKAGVRDNVQLALIDYKLLTHPDDIVVILDGIKFIFRIAETEAFKRINFTFNQVPNAACSAFTFLSDDYWKCYVQLTLGISNHPVGTCRMGPDSSNSTKSVVDTKFRVRGVPNLRVVDASVIPEITNANINAPVMLLAEKAAEDIINFHQARH